MVKRLTFSEERMAKESGFRVVVGVDEVGVGPLAGPVVAAAVVLPEKFPLKGLQDSKKLTEKKREELDLYIKSESVSWAIAQASVEEINEIGIRGANYLACRRAIEQIADAECALVDAWTIPGLKIHQKAYIKGDSFVPSIAAASVIAKVYRDALMVDLHKQYPMYDFHKHKGYGTKKHREAISMHGPCSVHRTSWEIFERL